MGSYIKKLKSHLDRLLKPLGLRSKDLGYSIFHVRALGMLRKAHKGRMGGNHLCQAFLQTVDPAVGAWGS